MSESKMIISDKKEHKEELYNRCYTKEELKSPLLVIYAPENKKGKEILYQLLEGLLVLSAKIIVISNTEAPDFVKHPSGKITWVNPEDGRKKEAINEYLRAADMGLIFDEHSEKIHELLNNGVVIMGPGKFSELQNYHPNEETGNSFTYQSANPWDIFRAIVRAHETFAFPYDWQNIVRGIVKGNKDK
jgi:hypothetical protein